MCGAQVDALYAGEVGYLAASIKQVADARVGDTITLKKRPAEEALPGYTEVQPMVFCGLFPTGAMLCLGPVPRACVEPSPSGWAFLGTQPWLCACKKNVSNQPGLSVWCGVGTGVGPAMASANRAGSDFKAASAWSGRASSLSPHPPGHACACADADQYTELREALLKLQLNDAALRFEPEVSSAMGFGFRCGFLGLLHMEIVQVGRSTSAAVPQGPPAHMRCCTPVLLSRGLGALGRHRTWYCKSEARSNAQCSRCTSGGSRRLLLLPLLVPGLNFAPPILFNNRSGWSGSMTWT